jgi:hypothetical protein
VKCGLECETITRLAGLRTQSINGEEVSMLRRVCLALTVVVVGALAVVASASAGQATSVPISWVMIGQGATGAPSADVVLPNCGGVPSGMWVKGTGTWTFFAPTGAAGNIQSMAGGTATDNLGNTYQWNYHQSVQPIGNTGNSKVVDFFKLSGSGPAAGVHSHFIAIIDGTSVDEATSFELLHLLGDPFDCDPI